ncbi:MAG: hypothetical protein ACODAE_01415 [Gemmatimonadota bacterium]
MFTFLIGLVLQGATPADRAADTATISTDSIETLVERVRDAQRRYERTMVGHIPTRFAHVDGLGECDEHVGRFCLTYEDDHDRPEEPEAGAVVGARRELIEELRRIFSLWPGEARIAGPLIRYLVQDDRAAEAVSAARTFSLLSTDTTTALLFEGFALHAAARDTAAEARFDAALARMSTGERRRYEGIGLLLPSEEREIYEGLDDAERSEYEREFWKLADPLYLTPGNERRAAHFARHVWARLLSATPRVRGVQRWGDDLEELTLRYGIPVQHARVLYRTTAMRGTLLVSWYDTTRLAFAPRALRRVGVPITPRIDGDWHLEDPAAATQFAMIPFRRVDRLAHRVARLPDRDPGAVRLRFDGRFVLDPDLVDREPPAARTGLFLLDDAYETVREVRREVAAVGDTVAWSLELAVPPDAYVYSLEAATDTGGTAARARYALPVPAYGRNGPALSDLLIRRPFDAAPGAPRPRPDGDPLPPPRWRVLPGDTLGLYAELHRLSPGPEGATRYEVEVLLRPERSDAALARAARWIGRRLGLSDTEEPVRVRWEAGGEAGRPAAIAFNLALDDVDPGLYSVRLATRDLIGGQRRTVHRLVKVEEPPP